MRYPAEVLTKKEVAALLEACGTRSWTDRRNRALIVVMYRAGTRLAETLALRPCDVDAERGAIRVLRGKGGRARTVGIDPWGLAVLNEWMDEHRTLGFAAGGPLFCTRTGRPVAQGMMRRRLPELARAAGIHKRVHAHGLRHTHAAELRAEGVDIAIIRRQLGHRSLLTTIGYLDHLAGGNWLRAIESRTMVQLDCPGEAPPLSDSGSA